YCSVVVWRNAKGISEAFIKNVDKDQYEKTMRQATVSLTALEDVTGAVQHRCHGCC
uniref:Uncharacterized protein n=1 Tax=Parascaris univalens TaxID=6257 RepID=A0A914ZT79_PARUN